MNNNNTLTKTIFLLLCCLCMAGGAQATVRTVTNAGDNGDNNNPISGSLRDIMVKQIQDGDIIEFDNALANDTIKLSSTSLYPFGSADNLNGKNLTVRGNGVAISGGRYIFGSSLANMNNLWVENIHFTDIESDYISFSAQSGRIRNCSFSPTANATRHLCIYPTGGTILFEGCAFIAGSGRQPYMTGSSSKILSKVSFVSCTFVKPAGSYVITQEIEISPGFSVPMDVDTDRPLISFPNVDAVEMTNCVVMDYSTGKPTFSVSGNKLASKGYNVILQSSAGSGWPASSVTGDNVMSAGATLAPLILDEGIYKVNTTQSPAYRHLPSQSVRATNDALAGIEFPEKDLAGEGIDYTCQTHSGAWQAVWLNGEIETDAECDGAAVTGITLTPPTGTVYTESGAYTITATVTPGDASPAVTWTSSDESVATIAADGNNTGRITPVAAGTTTITATSVATPAVTQTCEITVVAYPHVESITLELDTIRSVHHLQHRVLPPVILPEGALNRAFTWTIIDPDNVLAGSLLGGVYNLAGKQAGTAKLAVTAADGNLTDTCVLIFTDPHYTDGVFMLSEGNYPGEGRLSFLHPGGTWDYDLYTALNNPVDFRDPARDFGVTSQFGAIYGGKFYVTSKQGARLVVFDPVTVEQHREFWNYPSGDGRAFLGVDEHTGYVGTSSGIHVINLDNLCDVPGGYKPPSRTASAKAVETLPATTIEGTQSGSGLYTGQIGTMIRVGERVFAVHQNNGIRVINARTHTVETTLSTYHYAVLAQSYDGYLWAGATVSESTGELSDPEEDGGQGGLVDAEKIYNALIRIDPWTLEEKAIPLPTGVGAPPSTWAAWQADPFCSSPSENVLYWIDRKKGTQLIRRYDIAANTVTTVFDISGYPVPPQHAYKSELDRWNMYGPSFRIHPVTGDLYVWITLFHLSAPNSQRRVWEVHRINPNTGEKLGVYPLKETYWWPSLFIFPDNADPQVAGTFPSSVTLNATHQHDTLALRPLVSDADQMAASIVKTVEAIGDPALVSAFIRHDSLIITPLKDLAVAEQTTVALKFNSNGKVVTRSIDVTVQPGAIAHPVTGITLDRSTADLAVGQTLQLYATVAPADADNRTVTWTSANPSVASVDPATGLVTAHLAPQTVRITATTSEGGFTATCDVTTTAAGPSTVPVTGVTLDRTAATLAPGATLRLNATVNPAGATNRTVTWTSSQGTFATVDQSGLVTAHAGPGATRITVTTADGSFTAYCDVTVTASATYPFALNTHAVTLNAAQYVQLSLTYPQAYPAVTWHSENENIAIVSATGRVAALAEGTTRIYAEDLTQPNRSDYCTVTVQPAIVQNPFELNTHSLTLDVAESVQLRLTAPEQYTVTWRTVDEDVAIVSSTGRVIGVGAGTTQVIAEDRSRGKSDACTVTVRAQASHRTVSLSHTMLILNEGQRTAIRATVTPAGATVAWSSANASIADVTPTGTVIALMSGNTNITASLPDGTSATCNVTVRDIDLAADVLDIEPHAATLAFPRLSGTAYYLVHLFEVSAAGDRIPEIALKVNPDGSIANIIGLRASPVSISLTVNGLRASTAYEADIDVIREINGTDEAVTTMTVTFTTAESPTANAPAAASLAPQAWYAAGALRLTNLDGHRVEIYTPSGRTVAVLTVATPDETHRHPFPPGLYILRATTPTTRTTLKFIVP